LNISMIWPVRGFFVTSRLQKANESVLSVGISPKKATKNRDSENWVAVFLQVVPIAEIATFYFHGNGFGIGPGLFGAIPMITKSCDRFVKRALIVGDRWS
jgi:hypothetical protein